MRDLGLSLSGNKPRLPALITNNLQFLNLNSHATRTTGRPRSNSKPKRLESSDITKLKTSFNPADGLRDLRSHKWQPSDLQYIVLSAIVFFSFYITPSAPLIKTLALSAISLVLLMPATRQFFLPSAVIWIWLLYFFSSR